MTWFRVGGAGIPASLKNAMNAVLNKKFGTSGQNYPPNGWPADVNLLGPLPEKTVAGAIAHTDDASDTVPVKSVICSIVPKQAGSGTPSPTNVRALSGYTGLTASQRGKNLFGLTPYYATTSNTPTFSDCMLVKPGTYMFSFDKITNGTTDATSWRYAITIYNLDGTINSTDSPSGNLTWRSSINAFSNGGNSTQKTIQLTFTNECRMFVRFWSGDISQDMTMTNPQLEVGSSASSFEAYNAAADISDSWSSIGEIYGGERDLTEGTLKSKGFINVFDTVDENVIGSQYYNFNKINGQVSTVGNTVRITFNAKTATNVNRISSSYSFVGCNVAPHKFAYADDTEHFYINTVFYLYIDKTICGETSSDVFNWLVSLLNNGTPLQVYMEYSTATEYNNLSAYDFETLYAVNNFYSDIEGGQTQLTYRQDIALALAALQGSRSLSASLMRSSGPEERTEDPEEVSEPEENIQNTEEQEGENDAR